MTSAEDVLKYLEKRKELAESDLVDHKYSHEHNIALCRERIRELKNIINFVNRKIRHRKKNMFRGDMDVS